MTRIQEQGSASSERMLERLRWRSRRGLLEMDLLLQRFLEHHLVTLTSGELDQYGEVLQLDDNGLLDRVLGRIPCEPEWVALLEKIGET
ncbi:succinate dehydrogenase assembly factor 2 [Ferrovum myxofaciens]|uniref:FAD assembly factor SdhE n=2 Tax=root TaxID=1 RepID=A0A8F3IJK6_9PROT|nr:succinate dehydrogenase assembly factor 2 [Ferrovum myxofaciens]MBW8028690.1 succinate dehydrogenase assembly factor 2 [Ferrovum sp.]KXW58965.1 flavinator of succinate dehydrogenase [Ferrovum myxofaciens]MBU6993867.1 succinate dehydrogenase assembly factor 2 [Ferrovum myxofaciens]NDU88674.1 succinate dehydrogenase assembly factor 2 [Ferrovum sp.]QKE37747.1 MAG: succinate dehydrogenase assembly factor 2 [Ferrovum myxofaciens]